MKDSQNKPSTAGNFSVDGSDVSHEDIVQDTREILEQSRQVHQDDSTVTVLGRDFVVYPDVFSPKFFNSSRIFAQNLPVQKGGLLEIGAGIGTITISLVLEERIDSAVATDINESAVENMQENVERFDLADKIDVRAGDMFAPIGEEKFDTVFCNSPFVYVDDTDISNLEQATFDNNYKGIRSYLSESLEYKKPNGNVYLGFSSTLGDFERLKNIANEEDVNISRIFAITTDEKFPVQFEIYEITE